MRSLVLGSAMLLSACGDATSPVPGADAALIQPTFSSAPLFWVVGEAKAGQPFTVQINTYGLSSCWGRERTDVQGGPLVIITPYNRSAQPAGAACLSVINRIPHEVVLSYPTAGEKHLVIRGRAFETGAPIHYPVTIEVRPKE